MQRTDTVVIIALEMLEIIEKYIDTELAECDFDCIQSITSETCFTRLTYRTDGIENEDENCICPPCNEFVFCFFFAFMHFVRSQVQGCNVVACSRSQCRL